MKKRNLVTAMILVTLLLLGTASTAYAAKTSGSIVVQNAVSGETYSIYRILDLDTDSETEPRAYRYTANAAWEGFVNSALIKDIYLKIDETDGHITWAAEKDKAEDIAAFVAIAGQYAQEQSISPVKEVTNTGAASVEFKNLPFGYYLVRSSLGALCAIDTTNPKAVIKEKNKKPIVTKEVQENSTGSWGKQNDAEIGDKILYQSVITAADGNPSNYVFHDTMSAGLTFLKEEVSVYINNAETPLTSGYRILTGQEEGKKDAACTFEIHFENGIIHTNDVVKICYAALLNENAKVCDEETNSVYLTYGENGKTTIETTKTFNWSFGVYKFTETEANAEGVKERIPLAGAEFILYADEACQNPVKLTAKQNQIYRAAVSGEQTISSITTDQSGRFVIEGLDAGYYYLKEINAPAGYYPLSAPVKIEIDHEGKTYLCQGNEKTELAQNLVEVLNQTGGELPTTGGSGTMLFYAVGALLTMGAGYLLKHKKEDEEAKK